MKSAERRGRVSVSTNASQIARSAPWPQQNSSWELAWGLAYTMYQRPAPQMSGKSKEVVGSNQLNLNLCVLWS